MIDWAYWRKAFKDLGLDPEKVDREFDIFEKHSKSRLVWKNQEEADRTYNRVLSIIYQEKKELLDASDQS